LGKGRLRRGPVAVPYLVRRCFEKLFEFLACPISDLYEHAREAADDENRRKQASPYVHGGFPRVGVHGTGSVEWDIRIKLPWEWKKGLPR
jgi:hypothetical protein